MTKRRRWTEHATRIGLVVASLALTFAVLETAVRIYDAVPAESGDVEPPAERIPLEVVCDCPFLYRPNPDHPDISSQGLRDREYAIPKPAGVRRFLVLGDSVPFGAHVPVDRTFPNQLEEQLNAKGAKVEVINAGVRAYTTYNELHYYLGEGRRFEPDVVILTFSLNDVADPRLHWNWDKDNIEDVPAEAIPNPTYDEHHIAPILEARRRVAAKKGSRLIALLMRTFEELEAEDEGEVPRDAEGWPIYITGEDSISIEVLLDGRSPEWRWLRGMLARLEEAVAEDGASLVVVLVPLAYQLDPDYPYLPQELLVEHLRERSIPCLDLLPAFRRDADQRLFIGTTGGLEDVWHLTGRGHRLVARELEGFLARERLLR